MIKYLKQSEIDYDKWDKCIAESLNSMVYAYSWYLDIVAGEWDALIEDDYMSVFPLPYRIKLGIKYVYQPVLTQQLGVFSREDIDDNKTQQFVFAIPKDFKLIEINLNSYNKLYGNKKYKVISNTNIELNLGTDYESLKKAYSKNLKRNINKAKRNELSINNNLKPETLIELFKQNKGSEIDAFSENDYAIILRLMYFLIGNNKAEIIGTYSKENTLLCSIFIIKDSKRHIFIFSGLSDEGKEKGAMPFIVNNYIEEHTKENIIFDFEGSNNPSLARFFMGFGSYESIYKSLRYYQMNTALKSVLKIAGKI
ncbi:MAG: hypothetical protein B6I18_09340 [Bacteroidetes bacterium 4572_112]|nr:MAG: hypothetical protein B6I18_09340 [Bacteroidetes bacterium 4572_112]